MKVDCFLFVSSLVPLLVASATDDQTTQEYWNEKGDEELRNALKITINDNPAKNVILFVGDGMGPATLTAARIYQGGESSSMEFERFPHVALLKTYAVDRTVPDSACTATALFGGVKTNFEVSGVDGGVLFENCTASLMPEHRVTSMMHWAQEAGMDTGFVTTTRVTHATPSALYSHSGSRKWECDEEMPTSARGCKDIAKQMIEDEPGRNFKVIMGGGRQCLTYNTTSQPHDPIDTWTCKRQDGRDLIQDWRKDKQNRQANYTFVSNARELRSLDYDRTDYLLGIFANGHLSYEDMRDQSPEGTPSLTEMTMAAIKMLQKNDNGYVLMVEGGMIDQAHHRGFARRALEETKSFNSAVAAAVNLTQDDTLIIVTSDHSHGLSITGNTLRRSDILGISMNSQGDGVPYTTLTYATGGPNNYQYQARDGKVNRLDPSLSDTKSFDYSQQTGIFHDEVKHGGLDVAVFAKGPMAHLFHGVHEQSYVAHVIAYAANIGKYRPRKKAKKPTKPMNSVRATKTENTKNSATGAHPVAVLTFLSLGYLLC